MTEQKEMIIPIEVTDWLKEFLSKEPDVVNQDDIVKLAREGVKPMKLARMVIVARELGIADPDILPPNKVNLNTGGAYTISQVIARRNKEYNTENGNVIKARELVAQVKDGDDLPNVVDSKSKKGCERAINYLHSTSLGHIKSRLNIIALVLGAPGIIEHCDILKDEIENFKLELLSKLE